MIINIINNCKEPLGIALNSDRFEKVCWIVITLYMMYGENDRSVVMWLFDGQGSNDDLRYAVKSEYRKVTL